MTGFGALVIIVLLLAGAAALLVATARIREVDVAWLAGGVPSDQTEPVYRAFLTRRRNAQLLGALAGAAVASVVRARWTGEIGFNIGVGVGPIAGDLLVGVLSGMTLGTLASESYRLSPAPGAKREASLSARPERPLPRVTWLARGFAALAVVIGVVSAVAWVRLEAVGGAVLAVAIGVLAELTQRAITDRRRPADERVAAVDERLRSSSGISVAWLQFSGAVLGLGWTLAALGGEDVGLLPVLILVACLVVAIVALVRSANRPPRDWVPEQVP